MQKLIAGAQRDEVKYIVRGFQAKLRVGINNASILTALGHAFVLSGCCFGPGFSGFQQIAGL